MQISNILDLGTFSNVWVDQGKVFSVPEYLITMNNKSKEAFLCSWICSDCAIISQNRGRYSERWYEPNSELLSKFSHPPQWSWDFQTSAEAKWTALDGWVVKRKLKERGRLLMQLCVLVFLDPYLFLPLVLYLFVHIPDPTKYIWSDSTSDFRSVLTHITLSMFELLELLWKEKTPVQRLSKGNCTIPI